MYIHVIDTMLLCTKKEMHYKKPFSFQYLSHQSSDPGIEYIVNIYIMITPHSSSTSHTSPKQK